jgi:peptidoglycan/xylan/chitin deacetylase (PgdA/CDA1 family)
MPRTVLTPPAGGSPMPDIPNWAWHEYGNRVGFWRLLETLDNLKITAALAINGTAIKAYEPISRAAIERKWEFIGHGLTQTNMQHVKNEREDIIATRAAIERITGRRPRGWLGPGLTETDETPDLLAAAGVQYVGDFVHDDEPAEIATRHGPLVTLPYTVELNDIPMMMVQHHRSAAFLERARDQFDRLYQEGADRAKILCFAIHPYISGVPHRIKYLEAFLDYARGHKGVAFWTGEEILDWYRGTRGK